MNIKIFSLHFNFLRDQSCDSVFYSALWSASVWRISFSNPLSVSHLLLFNLLVVFFCFFLFRKLFVTHTYNINSPLVQLHTSARWLIFSLQHQAAERKHTCCSDIHLDEQQKPLWLRVVVFQPWQQHIKRLTSRSRRPRLRYLIYRGHNTHCSLSTINPQTSSPLICFLCSASFKAGKTFYFLTNTRIRNERTCRRGNRNSDHIHGSAGGCEGSRLTGGWISHLSIKPACQLHDFLLRHTKQTNTSFVWADPEETRPIFITSTRDRKWITDPISFYFWFYFCPSKRKIINIWWKRRLMRNFLQGLSRWHIAVVLLRLDIDVCDVKSQSASCPSVWTVPPSLSLAPETLDRPLIRLSEPWCDGLLELEPETIKIQLTSHNSSRTSQRNQSSLSLLLFLS